MKAYVSQRLYVVKGKTIKDAEYPFRISLWVAFFADMSHIVRQKSLNLINLATQMWAYLIATTDLGGCMKP